MFQGLQRLEGWPEILAEYIRAQQAIATIVWGKSDCAFFAGNGVLAMTGVDVMGEYRKTPGGLGTYTTEKGAALALGRRDGTLDAAMTSRFGDPVTWMRARRGDVVMIETDDLLGQSLGLCLGVDCAFRNAGEGIVLLPTADIAAAWVVGE